MNDRQDLRQIYCRIEHTRAKLRFMVGKHGERVAEADTIEVSQTLDQLIVDYMRATPMGG